MPAMFAIMKFMCTASISVFTAASESSQACHRQQNLCNEKFIYVWCDGNTSLHVVRAFFSCILTGLGLKHTRLWSSTHSTSSHPRSADCWDWTIFLTEVSMHHGSRASCCYDCTLHCQWDLGMLFLSYPSSWHSAKVKPRYDCCTYSIYHCRN